MKSKLQECLCELTEVLAQNKNWKKKKKDLGWHEDFHFRENYTFNNISLSVITSHMTLNGPLHSINVFCDV